ncbi:MAG: hypothetical protein JNL52_10285 [Flavobacteriales bacterium]|nr:hypothetical protein [Flavobacteriales bacterium]
MLYSPCAYLPLWSLTRASVPPGTAQKLLTHFGSTKGIREALPKYVLAVVGAKKAEVVMRVLRSV